MLKNNLKGKNKNDNYKMAVICFDNSFIINQIVIILEKEKLEKKLNIILKIANGEPLTKEEKKHARKFK